MRSGHRNWRRRFIRNLGRIFGVVRIVGLWFHPHQRWFFHFARHPFYQYQRIARNFRKSLNDLLCLVHDVSGDVSTTGATALQVRVVPREEVVELVNVISKASGWLAVHKLRVSFSQVFRHRCIRRARCGCNVVDTETLRLTN